MMGPLEAGFFRAVTEGEAFGPALARLRIDVAGDTAVVEAVFTVQPLLGVALFGQLSLDGLGGGAKAGAPRGSHGHRHRIREIPGSGRLSEAVGKEDGAPQSEHAHKPPEGQFGRRLASAHAPQNRRSDRAV